MASLLCSRYCVVHKHLQCVNGIQGSLWQQKAFDRQWTWWWEGRVRRTLGLRAGSATYQLCEVRLFVFINLSLSFLICTKMIIAMLLVVGNSLTKSLAQAKGSINYPINKLIVFSLLLLPAVEDALANRPLCFIRFDISIYKLSIVCFKNTIKCHVFVIVPQLTPTPQTNPIPASPSPPNPCSPSFSFGNLLRQGTELCAEYAVVKRDVKKWKKISLSLLRWPLSLLVLFWHLINVYVALHTFFSLMPCLG